MTGRMVRYKKSVGLNNAQTINISESQSRKPRHPVWGTRVTVSEESYNSSKRRFSTSDGTHERYII